MLTAVIPAEGRRRAPLSSGERADCDMCSHVLIGKIGHGLITPHWAHEAGFTEQDCDPWSQPESDWHLGWKRLAVRAGYSVEVPMKRGGKRHRADARLDAHTTRDAITVEFQHSPLRADHIRERGEFWLEHGTVIWVFSSRWKRVWRLWRDDPTKRPKGVVIAIDLTDVRRNGGVIVMGEPGGDPLFYDNKMSLLIAARNGHLGAALPLEQAEMFTDLPGVVEVGRVGGASPLRSAGSETTGGKGSGSSPQSSQRADAPPERGNPSHPPLTSHTTRYRTPPLVQNETTETTGTTEAPQSSQYDDEDRSHAGPVYRYLRDTGAADAVTLAAAVFPEVWAVSHQRAIARVLVAVVFMRSRGVLVSASPDAAGTRFALPA